MNVPGMSAALREVVPVDVQRWLPRLGGGLSDWLDHRNERGGAMSSSGIASSREVFSLVALRCLHVLTFFAIRSSQEQEYHRQSWPASLDSKSIIQKDPDANCNTYPYTASLLEYQSLLPYKLSTLCPFILCELISTINSLIS
jgi:hypothetical protein